MRLLLFVFILTIISSCATYKFTLPQKSPTNTETPTHSVFLIANTDQEEKPPYKSARILQDLLDSNPEGNTLLMLGNNSTKTGTADTASQKNKKEVNEILKSKYNFFNGFKGNKYFVAGPNEWDIGGKQGLNYFNFLEVYTEEILELGNIYRPDNGCPGPEEIHLSDDIVLLLINTQWWLHNWERPGREDGCIINNEIEFLDNLNDAIKRNYNKKIIVAGHHSMKSSSLYGGFYPFKTHIFPFTATNKNLYIPLPLLGSVYVFERQLLGEHQDLRNHIYRRMINAFEDIFSTHNNLMYVSGHDLSMEYDLKNSIHMVNSGSFSGASAVNVKKAEFTSSDIGFGKLDFYKNGDVALRFYAAGSTINTPVFEKMLFNNKPIDQMELKDKSEEIDYSDSIKSAFITNNYSKKSDKPGPLGNNYRAEWSTVVGGIPYLDLSKEKGGLEIKSKGGGMQTRSLRLEAHNKKEYVLRSINKYPQNAVPMELRGTFAENLIAEQISSAHPYAAFTIPELADAAGIYHTNPKLIYLPDDTQLGVYRKDFGGGLFLYEERPDDDWSDQPSFGNS